MLKYYLIDKLNVFIKCVQYIFRAPSLSEISWSEKLSEAGKVKLCVKGEKKTCYLFQKYI